MWDWKKFEDSLPKKIKTTRKRPNTSGLDMEYIRRIDGIIKGNTVIIPGLTKTGKKKVANYVGIRCESATFGLTRQYFKKNPPIEERLPNKLYPQLYENLKYIANYFFPDFKYNTITLNHNFKCKPHKDGKNRGSSMIIGFGNYLDGELNIEGIKHDIRYKPLEFDGSKKEHWVEDWEGDRWTAVYFFKKL